jgi:hypothetical protein
VIQGRRDRLDPQGRKDPPGTRGSAEPERRPAGRHGLDGAAAHCPAGMTLASLRSLCFESTQAAAGTYPSAFVRCINAGLRLPSMGELGTVYVAIGGSANEANWSDDATSASSHNVLRVAGFTLALEDHPNSDSVGSRCVIAPHNNLGASPTSAAAQQSSTRFRRQVRSVARSSSPGRNGH